ncbi:MAG: NAD-dependent epimerase/dehydratase family protein [Pedobacter sp.]|nr:NAD-dependent epimerase/dehydratase family protein [Pedobacter sp.]MDQ8052899.1 NAD-dependent epimerase/dehydratase family protein [Pedobacter sp.]
MKISITGSTGFVGQNLLSYLSGFTIAKIDRQQLADFSIQDLEGCEAIVHLAGKAHDLKKVSAPEAYYEVNFELTKKLYDAFLQSDAKKFIFISSVKAVADVVDGVLTEEAIPDPKTDYGKSKLMAEAYIMAQDLPPSKSYYILRPCMIHGPGNKGNLNLLYQFVKRGLPFPLAGFQNKRSFLSIENLCFVIKRLLEKDIPTGIYQVADDTSLSTNEVVALLAKAEDKRVRLWKISPKLIGFLAKLGDRLSLPLNTERLTKLTESYVVGNQKILKVLQEKLPVSSEEGLMFTARSFGKKQPE